MEAEMGTMEAATVWTAPGPGMWERDEAHQSAPFSTYNIDLFNSYSKAGIEEGSRRYGLLIETFDLRWIDRWMYMRLRIAGAPEKPGPMPPRWMFKLLFVLHPALRRRTKAAREAIATSRWRQDAEWWVNEGRASMRDRLRGLQSVDLTALDAAALREHHTQVHDVIAEGTRIHFRNALAHWIGMGDWLAKAAEWTGSAPDEVLHALEGASPFSVDALAYLDRIAAGVKDSPSALDTLAANGDAAGRLEALRAASPDVSAAIDEYLEEHGWRIFTGFDVMDQAVIEMPESVLQGIAGRLSPMAENDRARQYAAELRARVPAEHLAEYDTLFSTARLLYGVRDDDAGPCIHWAMGLVRRFLLEVGNRLVEGGRLAERDLIFEASRSEVDDLLGAPGAAVSNDELTGRAAARVAAAANMPPPRLGEDEGPPPPDDWMPQAVARVNGALMLAMSVEMPAPVDVSLEATTNSSLKGLGASRGVVEGRACVAAGPEDFSKLRPGDILVAPFTTTAYNVILPILAGVVTDKGGILSHAAIVAREYAMPAVVNTGDATSRIMDGARLRIDGATGIVEILPGSSTDPVHPAVGSTAV
jgi:pyruvate,water dikinase